MLNVALHESRVRRSESSPEQVNPHQNVSMTFSISVSGLSCCCFSLTQDNLEKELQSSLTLKNDMKMRFRVGVSTFHIIGLNNKPFELKEFIPFLLAQQLCTP